MEKPLPQQCFLALLGTSLMPKYGKSSDKNHFITKRVLVLVGILLIYVFIIISFHHEEDGEKHETCSICILIENLSHCFISNPPTLVLPAISYVLIVFYPSLCPCVVLSSYHSRAPPFSFPQR
jgi:hypothetical protein